MSKIDNALAAAIAGVELAEKRIQAFKFITEGLSEFDYRQCNEELAQVHSMLYKKLNEQYRQVFMWGVLKPELRLAAKELALKHYLKKDSEIMNYLDSEGKTNSYYKDEEEQFRKEIEELKKEIKNK